MTIEGNLIEKQFVAIDRLTTDEKKSVIKNVIIPLMDLRRGRGKKMVSDEVDRKLRSVDQVKPGELVEYFEALFESHNFNTHIASELADITYYGLQDNASPNNEFEYLTDDFHINDHGLNLDSILSFCIIKYTTRLRFGDNEDYKEIEYKNLEEYINANPNMTETWINKNVKLPHNSEIMRTYCDIFGWD